MDAAHQSISSRKMKTIAAFLSASVCRKGQTTILELILIALISERNEMSVRPTAFDFYSSEIDWIVGSWCFKQKGLINGSLL